MQKRWPLRVLLAVVGSMTGAVEIAVLLARHSPNADALNRLYTGIFMGLATGVGVLCWALFAPDWQHTARRVCLWLLVLTPVFFFWRS